MTGRLFTSESVTEGHPDKIADQISDSVLDAMLEQDPHSRVAVETLLTTGLVVVAGEVTTTGYVDIKQKVRDRILEIGYDSSEKGFDGNSCGVMVAIGGQSGDIAQGVDTGHESRTGSVDAMDKQGAGDQGLMFGYACDDTDVLMPLPIVIAQRLAERLTAVRKDGTLAYLRPDGKTQVTIEYDADNRPVRVDTVVLSSQHSEEVELDTLESDVKKHVIDPVLADVRHPVRGLPPARQPDRPLRGRRADGRRRPHRPQDHRRHLRRHGPPRRRRLLRQGPVEGRPLRGVRHALGGQERRRRRAGPPLRGPGRLRHRQGPAGRRVHRDLRHRRDPRRGDPEGRARGLRPAPGGDHRATSTCCARSTPRPRRTATSAASCPSSPGSAPTAPTRSRRPRASDRELPGRIGAPRTAPNLRADVLQ